jgi:hypothetical protein
MVVLSMYRAPLFERFETTDIVTSRTQQEGKCARGEETPCRAYDPRHVVCRRPVEDAADDATRGGGRVSTAPAAPSSCSRDKPQLMTTLQEGDPHAY